MSTVLTLVWHSTATADRCFVIDEKGEPVTPSAVTALVAEREIARAKAEGNEEPVIIYNLTYFEGCS